MPATYEPIASTTLSSAQSSITFSSIPSTYTDLRVVLVYTCTAAGESVLMRFNSDTGTNYSLTWLLGDGASAVSIRQTNIGFINASDYTYGSSTTIPYFLTADIFCYSGSTYKSSLITCSADQNGQGDVNRKVALWRSTAAISTISMAASNFATGTTATLYGIKAA